MDTIFLLGATLCFFFTFGYTLFTLGAGRFRPGRMNLAAMCSGFLFLSIALWHRGNVQKACPIHSLSDVLVFTAWSIVLFYLLVGPAYRLSLLGAFTSPLLLFLLLLAQLAPSDKAPIAIGLQDPWVEFHAAFSLIAYGAFGLAGVAGLMYLLQDRQLKRRKGGILLYNLPPITDLAIANGRLLWLGFGLLTIGFGAGFLSDMPVNKVKFWASAVIWGVYGVILILRCIHSMPPRIIAKLSVVAFVIALSSLPAIQHLSAMK